MFKNIDPTTGMPTNSTVVGLLVTGLWLVYFYGANLAPEPWFGPFCFDSSELLTSSSSCSMPTQAMPSVWPWLMPRWLN